MSITSKIIVGLSFFIMFLLGWGAWDIRQNNIKTISSGEAHAGIFDDIKDAITGHIEDYNDRSKEDQFVKGATWQKSKFTWSSDSIHYANGSAFIIKNKDGKYFVQLGKDFNAGFAPDLYIYLAEGHISSDDEFKQAKKIELSKLIKGEGASYYDITSYFNEFDKKEFSVVIHCKRFNEPMGASYF